MFDLRVKINKSNVDLQSLDSSGSAGGGEEPGGQVPHQRSHAEYRGAQILLAGRESDVPPVGR